MKRGKQSVKKGVWYIGGKKKKKRRKKQKGRAILFGLIASLAAPVLGEIAKPVFKTIFGRGKKNGTENGNFKKKNFTKSSKSTKWKIFYK